MFFDITYHKIKELLILLFKKHFKTKSFSYALEIFACVKFIFKRSESFLTNIWIWKLIKIDIATTCVFDTVTFAAV